MKLIEELGKRRMLTVVKTVDFGIYLGTSEERVLLPKKEVPKEIEIGDPVEVTVRGYELSVRKADAQCVEVK